MTYSETLDAYLSREGNSVTALAAKIGTHQPNVTRYRQGERFPSAAVARNIDSATSGQVSFELWQKEFLERSGLAA